MAGTVARTPVPAASARETASVLLDVVVPLVARGVIIRRPAVVDAIERLDLDRRAVRRVQRLAETHGLGPVRIEVPGRTFAVVLDPADVQRVLGGSPDPFAPATREKRAALAPFQPHGVLASAPDERQDRRGFNDAVLESAAPMHHMAGRLQDVMVEEARNIASVARAQGQLDWDGFITGWYRMVRRLVLGDGARDDHTVTDLLGRLRSSGNWSVLGRSHRRLREEFLRRLERHLQRAEPGSLAELVAAVPSDARTAPVEQVPQWLFAYDAAAWTCMRMLALLCSDDEVYATARAESDALDQPVPADLPFLRACVLDTLRLYPTTPAILRETTRPTQWDTGTLPPRTTILVFAPYFHRDDRRSDRADAFTPGMWMDDTGVAGDQAVTQDWSFFPFSAGPAVCPGRQLVLLTVSTVAATLLRQLEPVLVSKRLDPGGLPSALSPFSLRLRPAPSSRRP